MENKPSIEHTSKYAAHLTMEELTDRVRVSGILRYRDCKAGTTWDGVGVLGFGNIYIASGFAMATGGKIMEFHWYGECDDLRARTAALITDEYFDDWRTLEFAEDETLVNYDEFVKTVIQRLNNNNLLNDDDTTGKITNEIPMFPVTAVKVFTFMGAPIRAYGDPDKITKEYNGHCFEIGVWYPPEYFYPSKKTGRKKRVN